VYASIRGYALRSITPPASLSEVFSDVLCGLETTRCAQVVSAGDGDPSYSDGELVALETAGLGQCRLLHPKSHFGNLFAAAAPVQVALAALLANLHRGVPVLANCFGHGTEQAAFVLEAA
jgi:hypothetical protein